MSEQQLPGTPGTGDIPEPEPEDFRDQQIEAEEERQAQQRQDAEQRSREAKEQYSGKAAKPGPLTGAPGEQSYDTTQSEQKAAKKSQEKSQDK